MQLTGALYYFNNASNRQHFQNYFYHTISSVFSELDHMNILILIAVCIIGFTEINYSLINIFANINILWSRPLINVIFLCLRFISAIKVVIAILRGAIKARKFSKFEARVSWSTGLPSVVDAREKLNNRCVICLDELHSRSTGTDKAEKVLTLRCNHMFHLGCFKQWYETSGSCPFCRTKVEL
ncbi:hypothetical protein PICMEDRAFT_138533 [Pichia membranifaciens NRRL Y-2026]|uniref:RING-type domain-containing protein n=1 Tax=Pichia membranifaciens NRRL Y-2026 TaxID=763406 RepID=A0A1E3NL78_9ASCO|nr:hypothetical protein PICMEDRAFT_138533 [Pichia membranifaciens NRRL Y-2026]ODQ46895.1 hypothetical protein PICMEDRAFT_138533 [Pichia membranifaciens NRRL Y-2026]